MPSHVARRIACMSNKNLRELAPGLFARGKLRFPDRRPNLGTRFGKRTRWNDVVDEWLQFLTAHYLGSPIGSLTNILRSAEVRQPWVR